MALGVKFVAVGLCVLEVASLLHAMSIRSENWNNSVNAGFDEGGQVGGRIVSIPAQVYREEFKATLRLGQCPLKKEDGTIKICKEEFSGEEMFLAKGSMTVDVTNVKSKEDFIRHIMGGIGASVGILGLISLGGKIKTGVTTDTFTQNLNMLSSYEISKGVISLHNPKPKGQVPASGALYLSEIELGGNEHFLVTLEFKNEKDKIDVETSIKLKVLFWSISETVSHIIETFQVKAKARIQFGSSWRPKKEESYSDLEQALPAIKRLEEMFMNGPQEMSNLSVTDERTHSVYYFSSWKQSPYGSDTNLALINLDNDLLTKQNTEFQSVLHDIKVLKDRVLMPDQKQQMLQLNQTVSDKMSMLTTGLNTYHLLTPDDRQSLYNIYGINKAPLYYSRQLQSILEK